MKKYLIITLFFITSSVCSAQGLRLGVFADPQISWMVPDSREVESDGSRFGFNIGLLVDNYFAENYAFSTGLSINGMGGDLKYSEPVVIHTQNFTDTLDANASITYKLQYLSVPLALKFKTNEIGYKIFYAHMGLNTHINVKAVGSATSNNIKDENISKDINLLSLSYHFGGGIQYSLGGSTAINLGVIYTNGFTDITKDKDNKAIVRSFSFRLGILF